MATNKTVLPRDIDETTEWLKANPAVIKKSIDAVQTGDMDLCDAIALRPQLLLEIAGNTHKEALAAKAPKQVLLTLKTRQNMVRDGLKKLPKYAYSWLSVFDLRGVDNDTKARSILVKAASKSPDKANQKVLGELVKSIEYRRAGGSGGGAVKLPCWLCCALACMECGPGCIVCCVFGCLLCTLF